MSEIDIRTNLQSSIQLIRFADESVGDYDQGDIIQQGVSGMSVEIAESNNGDFIRIRSAEHADNLITALNKAKELGWLV